MDTLTPKQRSDLMSRIHSSNTKPELFVRRLLWSMGYRYRLHGQRLAGRPDIVFKGRKKVIFVNGCFWHCHQDCKVGRIPKSRQEYWKPKLEATRKRDAENLLKLTSEGWEVLVVWECEINDEQLPMRLAAFLR